MAQKNDAKRVVTAKFDQLHSYLDNNNMYDLFDSMHKHATEKLDNVMAAHPDAVNAFSNMMSSLKDELNKQSVVSRRLQSTGTGSAPASGMVQVPGSGNQGQLGSASETVPVPKKTMIETVVDGVQDTNAKYRVNTPSSCSFNSQQTKGQCYNKYTGATTLMKNLKGAPNVALDIHLQIDRCRDTGISEGYPAGGFGLSGTWINAIRNPTPCNSGDSCGAGLTCSDFSSTDLLGNQNISKGYKDLFKKILYKESAFTQQAANIDKCLSQSTMFSTARTVVLALAGKPSDGSSKIAFCTPNVKNVEEHIKVHVVTTIISSLRSTNLLI